MIRAGEVDFAIAGGVVQMMTSKKKSPARTRK